MFPGLVWQLMRAYTKGMLDKLSSENESGSTQAPDVEIFIISWVNAAVSLTFHEITILLQVYNNPG